MLVTRPARAPRSAHTGDGGAALISVIVVTLVLGLVTVTLAAAVVNTTATTVGVRGSLQAQAAADAGMAAAVAAAKAADDVCAATVSPGAVPGSSGGGTYTASVTCDGATTRATITATGSAGGSTSTMTAVYSLVPKTREENNPSVAPVGLVVYEGLTLRKVTLLAHGDDQPQLISMKGPFECHNDIPGNLIVGGDVLSTNGCTVTGDVYAAGIIDFSADATTVLGDVLAAGTGLSKINSSIGSATASAPLSSVRTNGAVDLLWSKARLHANVIARGNVAFNDRVVDGSITLPTASSATDTSGKGHVTGGVVKSDTIATVPPPPIPAWFDYTFKASDWPGAAVITLRDVRADATDTCGYFNSGSRGWHDLANYTGTVVVDARACNELSSDPRSGTSTELKATNVVLLAKHFDATALTLRSAPGADPRVWFVTEDLVDDDKPSCPWGLPATNFRLDKSNFVGVRSLVYSPCRMAVRGASDLFGSMYVNGFDAGYQITITSQLMALPGMPPPDGGYGGAPVLVETGEHALGAVLTRRAGAP